LAEATGASQPNVSQHLAVLRNAGIVEAERDGREVRYRLTDPDVMVACGLMRTVLERRLTRLGEMAASAGRMPVAAAPAAAAAPRATLASSVPIRAASR
jgi:ArsR family transcriptional regulator